jgi:hypothetical protein
MFLQRAAQLRNVGTAGIGLLKIGKRFAAVAL